MHSSKEARRSYEREWRKRKWATDPEYRERKKSTDKRWRVSLLRLVDEHKVELGCSSCGYKKCARALQFHHIGEDKVDSVADLVHACKSQELIWEEIEKCIVLCANCHGEMECRGCSVEHD